MALNCSNSSSSTAAKLAQGNLADTPQRDQPPPRLSIPSLLKMVSEPLNDYCQQTEEQTPPTPPTGGAPKLGCSRSQDDERDQHLALLEEQRFGSVSPIPQTSRISALGAARATNFRLKFRKSHTCGSLFANCHCSESPASEAALPLRQIPIIQQTGVARNWEHAERRSTSATAPQPHAFHLSISPSSMDVTPTINSISSRYTASASSGFHSLSTQTSSATTASAQLSRDESMSASFDYIAPTTGGDGRSSSVESPASVSQVAAKQANSIETLTVNAHQLQIPRISPPPTLTPIATHAQQTRDIIVDNSIHALPKPKSPAPTARTTKSGERERPKARRLFQSYSHPDTDFIFTDANKNPTKDSNTGQPHQWHASQSADAATLITARGGKIEIKQQAKRSSSPNIGHYQVLDVAIHPDILVKVSPKHSPIGETRRPHTPLSSRSTEQRRRLLQRSHEIDSAGSTSDSVDSSDVNSSPSTAPKRQLPATPPVSPVPPPRNQPSPNAAATNSGASFDAAQRYFAESGIFGGPIPATSSQLIRKTSKILQDSNVIEQIRKTSMILRANTYNNTQRKTSPNNAPTPPGTPTTSHRPLAGVQCLSACSVALNMETPAQIIYAPSASSAPHTMASCSFSPSQSCCASDDRDVQIKNLHGENVSLKDVIKSRDAEIIKLRREIHKLKSVLQQTTNHLPIANDDLLQSPYTTRCFKTSSSPTNFSHQLQQLQQQQPSDAAASCACCRLRHELSASSGDAATTNSYNGTNDATLCNHFQANVTLASTNSGSTPVTCALAATSVDAATALDTEIAIDAALTAADAKATLCNGNAAAAGGSSSSVDASGTLAGKAKLYQVAPVLKKQGVSGESCETITLQQSNSVPIPKFDKDYSSKQLIKEAIMDNDFLKNIDASQVRELVESMYPLSIGRGEFVVREGEAGSHLYVSAEGEFEVVKNGSVLGIMGAGKAFGELAILYNCTRTASIRVLSDARVWVLDRRVFQQIMMRTGMQRIENSVNFLKSVPLLKNLSNEVLAKIADVLEVEFYAAGTYIIRQGASGDTFFIISQGSVQVTQKLTPATEEKEIRTLECGDYFGEQALINEDKRTANIIAMAPGVECLTLDRDSFTHLIGDLCELKEKNYGDENRALAMKFSEKTKEVFGANVQQEFPDMQLTDLEVVATLGIGGFGRVELVKAYRDNRVDIFALKCLKKRHIVDTKQEEHVFSERTIMLTCNTPFICRLHRTFRDDKYVYMLLEACMGGEIWTMLRDRGSFGENATQFIIGCVLQAFEYLHARGIIYRDLKPENLMLDERGYVKLVDFGFAKYIGNSSKTWTFCGTPEYVAPEIILNKGHDRAVDYWALGILIHELLNGTPPFTANDPMKTYNIILKGIDMILFPKHMSRSAIQLIKRLCRDVPAERLGYQKGGIQDIKKHKWFLGFDWDGLANQLLIPPFVRPIAHPTDTAYFDKFPCDENEPPDEFSGWDADF